MTTHRTYHLSHCSYCGSRGHDVDCCPKTWGGSANRLHLRCDYCGGKDHNYEGCTKHWGGGKLPGAVRLKDRR